MLTLQEKDVEVSYGQISLDSLPPALFYLFVGLYLKGVYPLTLNYFLMNTDQTIKSRKTAKVLAHEPWTPSITKEEQEQLTQELLQLAAHAPYHYKSTERYKDLERGLTSSLPFRCYTLTSDDCRAAAHYIEEEAIPAGKVQNMLWASDIMMVMTWLPDVFGEQGDVDNLAAEQLPFTGTIRNMEHIAAASAATQNVLLGATARGLPNYWSSGGMLRQKELRDFLKIPLNELMLGCLFVFPKDSDVRVCDVKSGKLRDQGKEIELWSSPVRL